MKSANVVANAESTPKTVSQSDIAEQERRKSAPTAKGKIARETQATLNAAKAAIEVARFSG
jgi:hypothetical protein